MGKNLTNNDLHGRRATRSLLAVSLAASLAAFGCTTNQNLGNGTPGRSGGELRSAPTSGVTSGQERSTPPPMTSSYTRAEVLPTVTPRSVSRADRAAAIMAGHQAARGRYLGVVNPGPASRPYVSDQVALITGVPPNPSLQTNPQLTLNSSISSNPSPAINSGVGGVAGSTGGVLVSGATTATTATTGVTSVLPAGAFAASTVSPIEAASALPTVTATSAGTTATTATTTTTAATVDTATTNTAASAGVRIIRPTSGSPTITNTGTRNQ